MAGSITHEYSFLPRDGVKKVVSSWVSDASGDVNSVDAVNVRGVIHRIVTNPDGTDAPTANYDIVINDEDGIDVAAGLLANRHTSNTEGVTPLVGDGTTTDKLVAVAGALDIVVSNAGNAKAGTVTIYWS